jgi:hypothetical protein
MDTMEQFVCRSTITAAVLGNGNEFLLCYLYAQPVLSDADRLIAEMRGYCFCGLVGFVDGRVEVECEPFLEAKVIVLHAAITFAQNLSAPNTAKGDSLSWLENLHKLEDPRV